jgi:hypothetical protein
MPQDDFVSDWKKSAMDALGALDTGFLAHTAHSFIRAGWSVSRFPALLTLEASRIYVLPTAE